MSKGTGKMTKDASSRIQSTQAKAGHDSHKDSFPARAQSAADRNLNEAKAGQQQQSGNQQRSGNQSANKN
ncbi:uncharacterized protein BX663DRAFT_495295, partial [Cokeromyces recurvatus]|uniref:uncharacterized protein n=1 Tax=Cokeromyces recurvatus TaxID=90255 RepID=UPI002221172A